MTNRPSQRLTDRPEDAAVSSARSTEEACPPEFSPETACPDCACQENTTMAEMLRTAGMRPTRQRIALSELLFASGDRHVCAEMLHEEADAAKIPVSLATVYNTLNQFRDAGLLREVALVGTRVYFDTNMSDHQHFYVEGSGEVLDIPHGAISLSGLPQAPEGMEVAGVDVVVRLRPKASA